VTDVVRLQAVARDAEALQALHARVTGLEPGAHARPEHAARLRAEVVAPLGAALAEAIEIASRIEEACDLGEPEPGDWGEHLEPTGIHTDGAAGVVGAVLDGELWQQVGNLAFAARSELRRADRGLRAPVEDHDKLVVASESARRKLRRAIHALLDAVGAALGREFPLGGTTGEIEAAVAVRRMYAKFRRSLPPCDVDDGAEVRRALRLSAVSLAVMIGSSDFGEIRAPDRQLLLGLQARILAWARDGGSEATGRQLYLDLQTAADLLRAIDQRQELVAHDRGWLEQLARALTGDGTSEEILAAAGGALRALAGKDDELDAIAGSPARGEAAVLVARLRARLAALGWYPTAVVAA
jgi:hypothetical protein